MPNPVLSPTPNGNGARIVREGNANSAGPGPHLMGASTLNGDRVLSAEGDEVGKIKDIMLDVQSGRIAYAVMSSGGVLGIGDKLLAIPWNALTLDAEHKCFVLALPAERVKNAPGFDRRHWPSMADRSWATAVHEYYGREPYWSIEAALPGESARDEPPEAGGVKL
jgi:sporulation protein YlmC with PRC-barrel domain